MSQLVERIGVGLLAAAGDPRLRSLAIRQVFLNAPETLSPEARVRGQAWLSERLTTEAEVPWLTVPRALSRIAELRAALDPQDGASHAGLDAIESWLRKRGDGHRLTA